MCDTNCTLKVWSNLFQLCGSALALVDFSFCPVFRILLLFSFWSVFLLFCTQKNCGLACMADRSRSGNRTCYYCWLTCLSPVLVMGYDLCSQLLLGNYPCRPREQLCLLLSLLCLKANTRRGNSFVLPRKSYCINIFFY